MRRAIDRFSASVEMPYRQVSPEGFPGASGFAEVEAKVHAAGLVDVAEDRFDLLGQGHHFHRFFVRECG